MDPYEVTGLSKPTVEDSIKQYKELDSDTQELIQAAIDVRKFAYVPYSKFKVGAAFRTQCGRIFTGCNVENAAFTPTSCAERTAILKAISEGYTKFVAGAVVAYQEDTFTTPCGVCRQFIMEFAETDILMFITKDENGIAKQDTDIVLCTSIFSLLPHGFKEYLKK